MADAIIDRIAHESYRINIASIDAGHDISMREVYETDRTVFLDKREYTGLVYKQIESAVEIMLRNIRLGATMDGLVRRESYELPAEAIREMVINAHRHRNLSDESCIQVIVYDER